MLADLLKTKTSGHHQQLEKLLIGRMKSIRSTADYMELLQLFYSYFGGLEEQINAYITKEQLPDYSSRRKSTALANDIIALGGTPATKAAGADLPKIGNELQAFAALYVIEGSTLGGKIISKMIAQQLNISDGTGLSFFLGYGADTDNKWASFIQALNSKSNSPDVDNTIIDTANETFEKFGSWILKQTV